MPLLNYSKIDLRVPAINRLLQAGIIFFICFSFSYGYSFETEVSTDKEAIDISIRLVDFNSTEIIESIKNGFRSKIFFNIRIYEKTRGPLGLLGDKLILEEIPVYEGKWDYFFDSFLMVYSNKKMNFETELEFIGNFFNLENYRILINRQEEKEYYILYKVRIEVIDLVPPLNILKLFNLIGTVDTKWQEYHF